MKPNPLTDDNINQKYKEGESGNIFKIWPFITDDVHAKLHFRGRNFKSRRTQYILYYRYLLYLLPSSYMIVNF
jgi:hypothetical protein